MKEPFKWYYLEGTYGAGGTNTQVARVPGGLLFRTMIENGRYATIAVQFVPCDPIDAQNFIMDHSPGSM